MSPRRKPPVWLVLLLAALLLLRVDPFLVRVQAAITVSELYGAGSTSNIDPYLTDIASGFPADTTVQCALNALCLCFLTSTDNNIDTPTLTGGGQTTWTNIVTVDSDTIAAATTRMSVYRTLGEAGTAAALTADFADTQTGLHIHCWQFTNVDTSGTNGSGAVTQVDCNVSDTTTALAIDGFAALGASQVVVMAGHANSNTTWTPDTSFSVGTEATTATPGLETKVQYLANGSDATPTWTWAAAGAKSVCAVEVKEAAGAATGAPGDMLLLGVGR